MDTKIQSIEDAMYLLQKRKENTFVSIRGTERVVSTRGAILPIMERLALDRYSFRQASVASSVIDKAQAMLLVRSQVKEVYADVISEPALMYLGEYHTRCLFEKRVPVIEADDMAKVENAQEEKLVLDIEDYNQAFDILQGEYDRQRGAEQWDDFEDEIIETDALKEAEKNMTADEIGVQTDEAETQKKGKRGRKKKVISEAV